MPREELLNFTGNDLRVIEVDKMNEHEILVILEGTQDDPNFVSNIKNAPQDTTISPRRLLISNGITLEIRDISLSGRLLTVMANIRQKVNGLHVGNFIPLIKPGSFVAKPNHINGTKAMSAAEMRKALAQDFAQMSETNLDMFEKDEAEEGADMQTFRLDASQGNLRYYPESSNPHEWIGNRLFVPPGKIDRHSQPVWHSQETLIYQPNELIGKRIDGFNSRFMALVTLPADLEMQQTLNTDNGAMTIFDRNAVPSTASSKEVKVMMFDRRKSKMLRSAVPRERADYSLTQSYDAAQSFLDRLSEMSGHDKQKRIAALVQNNAGIEEILRETNSPWVMTNQDTTIEQQRERRQLEMMSDILPARKNAAVERSSEMKLLEQAQKTGMDGGAALVSEIFPEHQALNGLVASETHYRRPVVSTLLFREASANHGPFFSNHDYNSLQDLLNNGVEVYWANDRILHNGSSSTTGALLKLMRIEHPERKESFGGMAFVPPDKEFAFKNGLHLVFYGTARTLDPRYLSFMECLFDEIENEYDPSRPFVVHSGGGPDTSTMGVANERGRSKGWLSIGHVLGVDKEPTTRHLDALMPFRNENRDVRQGNMAKVADVAIALEGGGGTREERGITQTDLAIAREKPFPLILVGEEFYTHEYMQYLHEVGIGTLDPHVLNCISVIALDRHEDAAAIIREYKASGTVLSVIPESWKGHRDTAIEDFARERAIRQQAWKLEEKTN